MTRSTVVVTMKRKHRNPNTPRMSATKNSRVPMMLRFSSYSTTGSSMLMGSCASIAPRPRHADSCERSPGSAEMTLSIEPYGTFTTV